MILSTRCLSSKARASTCSSSRASKGQLRQPAPQASRGLKGKLEDFIEASQPCLSPQPQNMAKLEELKKEGEELLAVISHHLSNKEAELKLAQQGKENLSQLLEQISQAQQQAQQLRRLRRRRKRLLRRWLRTS